MDELISAVSAEPGLSAWLKSGLWKRSFDRGSLLRAELYTDPEITKIVEVRHEPRDLVQCEAQVNGSRKNHYSTRVGFLRNQGSWRIEADCSCPVGLYCKHAAAIVLSASGYSPSLPQPIPAAPTNVLDSSLALWLKQIEAVNEPTASPTARRSTKPLEKRFLMFCIEPASFSDSWRFSMRVGTHLNDGKLKVSETLAQADPTKPPKYMTREDFVPASLYHQRHRALAIWTEMRMENDQWEDLLETAQATGRLFAKNPSQSEWMPIQFGPVEFVEPAWEVKSDGSATPVLRSGTPHRIVLPTKPLRYLDLESGTIGLLEADSPQDVLLTWKAGPTVAPNQLAGIGKLLGSIAPTLPQPTPVETIRHPVARPLPHLKIIRRSFQTNWETRVIIVGLLAFRYGDSPLVPPTSRSDSPTYSKLIGDKVHIWKRDLHAESRVETRLLEMGFSPLIEILPAKLLGPELQRAVTIDENDPFHSLAWRQWLEGPSAAALLNDEWTFEIDPSSGLIVHNAGDLFPEIQSDADHGIDWFRFDAHFEVDGKRMSLLPFIAQAIEQNLPSADSPELPEFLTFDSGKPEDGSVRFPARRLMEIVDHVRHLFHGGATDGPLRIDRISAAGLADSLAIDSSETTRALAQLGKSLRDITALPPVPVPPGINAVLRRYQQEGFQWLQFLSNHRLNGILADDMGLGKTLQTLTYLAAEHGKSPGRPSLVIAPTSVVPNWAAEAEKFTPQLKILTLHGKERGTFYQEISSADVVLTSYPLLVRDSPILAAQDWHLIVLDEAQSIKNPKSITAHNACQLRANHRVCLSGTPMENHLGELWSLMRFLMPGFLGDEKSFNSRIRKPIERDRSNDAQLALNRRVSPLILRRTKDQVATELPPKTELIHHITLTKKQTDLYESVRAAMDKRIRDAIAAKGLAKSHIVVLDALLKLRQICCHPQLLKLPAAQKITDSAKLDFLTNDLLPTLLVEGRRILLFSSFTSMLALIEAHLLERKIPFLKLTGQTKERASLVKQFQSGEFPIFLISLKAGGTGLNLTAADTIIHYDPWWNPAAENQATDRAHRIGQTKPVFVHKLVCTGTIEDRILDLQKHKAALVEALLSEETSQLKIDAETLSHLLSPLD